MEHNNNYASVHNVDVYETRSAVSQKSIHDQVFVVTAPLAYTV